MRLANRLDCSSVGFRFHCESIPKVGKVGDKRGVISGFSKASVRRLRDYLLFLNLTTTERTRIGYTLTVPWCDLSGSVNDDYKASFNRFGVSFKYWLPNSVFVYRHELQKRKAPHLHGVLFLSVYDTNFDDGLIYELWRNAISPVHRKSKLRSFVKFGVKGSDIQDGFSAFRYLCDHASKHKQEQLGYTGKQWGVLGKKNSVSHFTSFHFDDRVQLIQFSRIVRKYGRFMVTTRRNSDLPLDCPFGSKHSKLRKMVSASFVPPLLLHKYLDSLHRIKSIYPITALPE